MGCAGSKIDDLPAVELCRHRLGFVREALDQRYALAEAHFAYIESLKSVGVSLRHFFDAAGGASIDPSKAPPSPLLNLPPRGKGKAEPDESDPEPQQQQHQHQDRGLGGPGPPHHLPSTADPTGHLSFHSDSDSDLSGGSDSPLHHDDDHDHFDDSEDDHDQYPSSSSSPPLKHRHHLPPSANILPGIYEDPTGGAYNNNYNNHNNFGGGYNPNPNFDPYYGGGGGGGHPGMYGAGPSTSGMYDDAPPSSGMYGAGPSTLYGGASTSTVHMNFMRKQPTPSVSYQHRPPGAETVHMGSGMDNNNYPYHAAGVNHNPNSYYYNNNNNNDPYAAAAGGYMNYAGESSSSSGSGFFGGVGGPAPPQQPGYDSFPRHPQQQQPNLTKPVTPPPPPPPPTSTWDFFNVFENIESTFPAYTPSRHSRDSRELREEEGIPDLEEEDVLHEVVKEVHGRQKYVDANGVATAAPPPGAGASSSGSTSGEVGKGGGGGAGYSGKGVDSGEIKAAAADGGGTSTTTTEVHYNARGSAGVAEPDPVEYEVHMVDKKVVGEGAGPGGGNARAAGGSSTARAFPNVLEVVAEIQAQFERASASGADVARILEVGKLHYHRKHSAYQVSSKMLHALAPSMPSTSRDSEASTSAPDFDEDMLSRSKNISSTLQKLNLWEKKLLQEVKIEEKMRILHDRKLQRLTKLDEKGAEPHKIDATRTLVRSLSTKIRISIHVVDKISVTISKVRDEELWPQLNQLIQGLTIMWRSMVECHRNQCEVVQGARGLDAVAVSQKNSSDSDLETILHLEHELLAWTTRFYNWVSAQKGFVKALHSWLFKCINTDPIDTPDGPAPFSPERAGAPPIFVICEQWAHSIERIPEKEVLDSMRVFAGMVYQFWERDKGEMRQRMLGDKDTERKVKNLDREDMRIQKQIQALDKKVVVVAGAGGGGGEDPDGLPLSGNVVYQSDTSNNTSLQAGLLRIFVAMEKFTSESLSAYEELLSRSEDIVKKHSGGGGGGGSGSGSGSGS